MYYTEVFATAAAAATTTKSLDDGNGKRGGGEEGFTCKIMDRLILRPSSIVKRRSFLWMVSACYTTFKYNLKQFLTPDGNRVVSLTNTQHDSKNTTFLCNKTKHQ